MPNIQSGSTPMLLLPLHDTASATPVLLLLPDTAICSTSLLLPLLLDSVTLKVF